MKRLLFTTPLVLLFLLNACTAGVTISDAQWNAMKQTETAQAWTPIPTQTFNPNISNMVNWLNADLVAPINSVEATMDAKYTVTNITFPNLPALTFRVDVGCICMNDGNCCLPERTFVVILGSLKRNPYTTLAQVPLDVTQMLVVCSDKANSQIGAISVSWQNVRDYLQDRETGYQLGVQVTRTIAPTMHP